MTETSEKPVKVREKLDGKAVVALARASWGARMRMEGAEGAKADRAAWQAARKQEIDLARLTIRRLNTMGGAITMAEEASSEED